MFSGYFTVEEFNEFFGLALTQEDFNLYEMIAVNEIKYLIGDFITVEDYNNLNEVNKDMVKMVLMYQIRYINDNKEKFLNEENDILGANVSLGRFSISNVDKNAVKFDRVDAYSKSYLQALGLYGNRAVGRRCRCGGAYYV